MGAINEKGLPTSYSTKPASRFWSVKRCILFVGFILASGSQVLPTLLKATNFHHPHALILKDQCHQVDPITPRKASPVLDKILDKISSLSYKNQSIENLSNAVKIPTVSHDGMGSPGEDQRWEIFYEFAAYLKTTFPLVHETLSVERVNTHGLFYTWKGTNSSLKPTLLLAHQDVVPVPSSTISTWTHPPFSGFYDGTYIWGRGSSDDKNQLTAIFEAIELLLEANFIPERTVLISLGFDEECSGYQGAGSLAPFILTRYGPKSIATIVDEGSGISEIWGRTFALPGVAEKGAIDVVVTIRMPGGHSSVPPPHTSIGVISELVGLIESDTYPTYIDAKNPYYSQMVCGASHAPDFPKNLKKLLSNSKSSLLSYFDDFGKKKKDHLAEEAAKESLFTKYLMTTSIAVDVIVGGEKDNALPEESKVTINHRVNIGDSVSDVKSKIAYLAAAVAKKHNLTLHAFSGAITPSSISLSTPHELEVAPVTPTKTNGTTAYSVLAGTTRALYGSDIIVAPGLMTGNTDTRFYWDLSDNIFRFGPGYNSDDAKDGLGKIHTVDESVSIGNHLAATKWFVLFLRNMDEAALE